MQRSYLISCSVYVNDIYISTLLNSYAKNFCFLYLKVLDQSFQDHFRNEINELLSEQIFSSVALLFDGYREIKQVILTTIPYKNIRSGGYGSLGFHATLDVTFFIPIYYFLTYLVIQKDIKNKQCNALFCVSKINEWDVHFDHVSKLITNTSISCVCAQRITHILEIIWNEITYDVNKNRNMSHQSHIEMIHTAFMLLCKH